MLGKSSMSADYNGAQQHPSQQGAIAVSGFQKVFHFVTPFESSQAT